MHEFQQLLALFDPSLPRTTSVIRRCRRHARNVLLPPLLLLLPLLIVLQHLLEDLVVDDKANAELQSSANLAHWGYFKPAAALRSSQRCKHEKAVHWAFLQPTLVSSIVIVHTAKERNAERVEGSLKNVHCWRWRLVAAGVVVQRFPQLHRQRSLPCSQRLAVHVVLQAAQNHAEESSKDACVHLIGGFLLQRREYLMQRLMPRHSTPLHIVPSSELLQATQYTYSLSASIFFRSNMPPLLTSFDTRWI
jgi:hypothetical protein